MAIDMAKTSEMGMIMVVRGAFDKGTYLFQKMREDELVLAVSPESALAGEDCVGMNDVVYGGRLIQRESGSGTRMVFENKLLEMGYDLSTVKTYMEVGSIGAIKSLVEANLGYTVVSRAAVVREVKAGTLRTVPFRDVRIMREFNFVYGNHRPAEFTDNLIQFLSGSGG